jgi:hypothetical protein
VDGDDDDEMIFQRLSTHIEERSKEQKNVKHVTLHKFSIVTVIVVSLYIYAACSHNG